MPTPYQIALELLTRRDYTQHELVQKLKAKNCCAEDISAAMIELSRTGYLDDKRSAESFVNSRRNKGYGPFRITQELRIRGIAEEIIAEALQITDNVWLVAARHLWQKRFKGQLPKDFKDRAKQTHYMQYRGFARDQIEKIFKPVDEEI